MSKDEWIVAIIIWSLIGLSLYGWVYLLDEFVKVYTTSLN